jgi:amidophosphoribosyltransferase
LGRFIAFQAAVGLHKRAGRAALLDRIYQKCLAEMDKPPATRVNCVKEVYAAFSDEDISAEISRMVYPEKTDWKGQVEVIFQTIENLHTAIEGPTGDWYFTGDYPTLGGFAMVNMAFIRWHEGISGRSYDLPL